jgi:hypothetical protein
MLDRYQVPVRLGRANVVSDVAFSHTMGFFSSGKIDSWWRHSHMLPTVTTKLAIGKREFAVIEGDVLADLQVAKGSVILVFGDLLGSITVGQACEVVICGSIRPGGYVSGEVRLFVGEDLAGSVRTCGASVVWVESDFEGDIKCEQFHTTMRVGANCIGEIIPSKGCMLALDVGRYMPFANIEKIVSTGTTMFRGSIGVSDRPAGLYPGPESYNRLVEERQISRWVIMRNPD